MSKRERVEILRNLRHAGKRTKEAVAGSLYLEGTEVMRVSQRRVPVKTGTLKRTGYVAPPRNPNNPTVEVGYGTKYAIHVHERTDVRHRNGQAKYLFSVIDETRSGYEKRIGKRAERLFDEGKGIRAVPKEFPRKPKTGKGR